MFKNYFLKKKLKTADLQFELSQMKVAQSLIKKAETRKAVDDESDNWILHGSSGDTIEGAISEVDHYTMLEQAWKFYKTDLHGRAIVRNLAKFVLGKGPIIKAKSENKLVQEAWDSFVKTNTWSLREKEMVRRVFRDGEVFMRFFTDKETGGVKARFVRANNIKNPTNDKDMKKEENVSYGIGTDKDDIEVPLTYYYCGKDGNRIAAIPANEIMHIKILTDSDMKRGMSFLLISMKMLKKYAGWMDDRIALNQVRSAIALIKQVEGTGATVESIRDSQRTQHLDADRHKQRMLRKGTVITATKGIEYKMLSPNINATDVKDDGRAMLMAVAAGSGFPEMMLTADYCHDMETEILTEYGFVSSLEAYKNCYKLATVKQDTGTLEYQDPTDWIFSNYDDDMYLYEGRRLNFCVSRNHHMWLRSENVHRLPPYRQDRTIDGFRKCTLRDTSDIGWRTKVASMKNFVEPTDNALLQNKTLLLKKYPYNKRNECYVKGTVRDMNRQFDISDMIEFVGWFVTEGSVDNKSGHINISQTFANKDNVKEIDEMAKRMPIEFSIKDYDDLGVGKYTARYWRTYDKALAGWIRVNCGVGARNKRLPNFVWTLSIVLKQKLLDTLIKGDGTKNESEDYFRYYSFSNMLLNDVQRLAFELGYHTTSKRFENNKSGYVDISSGHNCMVQRKDIKKFHYSGLIWCAIVPNGLLVTRRKGRILIAGNSNANYSSSITAQNPFVREVEDWQDVFEFYYKSTFERVVKAKMEFGDKRIPEKETTECTIEWPPLILADIEKNNKARETQHRNKIISKKTWQLKEGLDPEQEEKNMTDEEGKDIYRVPFNLPKSPINQWQSTEGFEEFEAEE